MKRFYQSICGNLPAIAIGLSGISFGTIGFFGSRLFDAGFTAYQMLFWRFLFASLLLLPLLKGYSIRHISLKGLLSCLGLGGIFYSLSSFCFFQAIPYIGSGIAMVIFYAFPLIVAFLNWIIDHQKLTPRELLAIVLMIPGVLLLALSNDVQFDPFGIVLGMGSALFYGIYFYASKRGGEHLPPVWASLMVCVGNMLFFALICWQGNGFNTPQSNGSWGYCVGIALLGTTLPLWLLFVGLKKVPVTKAALISVLEPISTVMIGVIVLDETLSFLQFFGMIIILAAAILVQLKAASKKPVELTSV